MDVLEAIKSRRSVRAYDPRDIPAPAYQHLLDALRFAPSACNFQPWRFILVRDENLRQKLAQASNGQMWIAQAPLTVVGCGLPDKAYKKMGGYANSVDIDVAIALDHLSLAAVAEGLATCWIGAFKEQQVKDLLNLPDQTKVVALMPVGYPREPSLNRPVTDTDRNQPETIFRTDLQD